MQLDRIRALVGGLVVALAVPALAVADGIPVPAPSPLARVTQTVGVAEASIEYSSPGVKGREIFGGLVPLGELWRTGANAATKLTLSHDATVAGEPVAAGTYAVFTVPGTDAWVFILNRDAEQAGTRSYDEKLDALRATVTPVDSPARERMTFLFENTTDDATELVLEWDETRIAVPIRFDTAALARAGIERFAARAADELTGAARYLAADDAAQALELVDAAIALDETWMNVWIKAELLAARGEHADARRLAERAFELGEQADFFFWRERVEKALETWPSE